MKNYIDVDGLWDSGSPSIRLFTKFIPLIASSFALLFANQQARGDDVFPFPGNETLFDSQNVEGLNNHLRLSFALYTPSTPANPSGVYIGARIFVVNANGGAQAQCAPDIPDFNGNGDFPFIFGQQDGNTTVAFWKNDGSLTVRCYNSAGKLISSVHYGPFSNAHLASLRFTQSGNIALHWQSGANADSSSHIAWLIGEYGQIITINGPYGPYLNTSFLEILDQKNDNQQWTWRSPPVFTSSSCTTFVWTFKGPNTAGHYVSVVTASLGPL